MMKDADKSFSELKKDQVGREIELLSQLLGSSAELKELATFESDLGARRNEILFKVTTEMEDTRAALRQAEHLLERLKKHLSQLEALYSALTKR